MPGKRFPSTMERSLNSLLMTFDLPALIAQMKREDFWSTDKRNAMTLLKGKDLRIVLIFMQAGTVIQAHQTDSPNGSLWKSGKVCDRRRVEVHQ